MLAWYRSNHRDLPWRHTREPYRIWVSEIMLQQTQVKTVLPRYAAWLERFPTLQSVAEVELDVVLKAWEGLGYYRRARFLHAAAQQMVQRHQACFPQDFEAIMALAGIGRSTAGAISSFCFQTFTPVLDGNVKRVLKRWFKDEALKEKALWCLAQEAIETSQEPALWNQAMMELGATLCLPRQADCAACPVAHHCLSAFQVSAALPSKKIAVQELYWQVCLHVHSEKGIWLEQRPDQGIWAGLWTPPIVVLNEKPSEVALHVHLLTHRKIHLYVEESSEPPTSSGAWFQSLDAIALPTGIHRLFEKITLYAN